MEECKKLSNDNIILKGNVDNVNDYLTASDYYISASESEGLPNSVLEAGRSGLNLILSDIPQHKEVFEKQLHFTSLFNVGDVETLTNLLDYQIKTNKSVMNIELANYIEENFSHEVMSSKYQELYKNMIK